MESSNKSSNKSSKKNYPKLQFQKDLKELNKLIGEITKNSQSGGKIKKDKNKKTFKIISVNGEKIPGGEGRYVGENHSIVSRKACNAACRKRNVNKINFELMETTRGSNRKVKSYNCARIKKKNPVIIKLKDDKGGIKSYSVDYDVEVSESIK
jgi:hypothetical protein